MKATTLFTLTIALVLGLGAAATAKYFGFFEPKAVAAVEKPPEKPPVLLLVAGTNLFKGHALSAGSVKVRPARPEELADYNLNAKDYLPPVVNAADFRIMADHLEADKPLKVKHLEPQEFESLEKRISPYMRAVNLDVPKVRCAGGSLVRDDRVDVLLTTLVATGPAGAGPNTVPHMQTQCIARDCRIVMKRNQLLTSLQTNPDVVPYTLEANPYRAALITHADHHGLISLVPRAKNKAEMPVTPVGRPTFADEESEEYKDEDTRVAGVEKATYPVGDKDLVRLFMLPELKSKVPPPPPVRVVTITGVTPAGEKNFTQDGKPVATTGNESGISGDARRLGGAGTPAGTGSGTTATAGEYYGPLAYYFQKPTDPEEGDTTTRATGPQRGAPPTKVTGAAGGPKKKL
ncbi:MAG TPA: Flp pilus assembly protein CpaB [Gemmataceae bacterium]|nr:Flp pilus assembly protein CpaB [Gemmataceae bacterium]